MKSSAQEPGPSSRNAVLDCARPAGEGGSPVSEETQAAFDRLVALAARLFDVPVSLVSLIDTCHEKVQANVGMSSVKTTPDLSLCRHVVETGTMMVIPDLRKDSRFSSYHSVVHTPHLRFYAGAPLENRLGRCVGTLCLVDFKPRPALTRREREMLADVAALVVDQWERHQAESTRHENLVHFESMAETSPDAVVGADSQGMITFWNRAAERLFGYSVNEAMHQNLELIVPEDFRKRHAAGLNRVASGGVPRIVGRTVELEASRRDGSRCPVEVSLSMWGCGKAISFGAIIRDVSERRSNELRLSEMARRDALTGLPNRAGLLSQVEPAAADTPAALMMIDLDDFREINETQGQAAGDRVLRAVGECIASSLRKQDAIARWGGDEFCVYLPGLTRRDRINALCDRIMSKLASLDGQQKRIDVNIGIALLPRNADDIESLIANADLALYHAKEERNQRVFFEPWLRKQAVERRKGVAQLRSALACTEYELFYQPQFRVTDGHLVGAEALIRWRHPEEGLIMPGAFLPALEASTLASEVGDWVLGAACAQASHWRAAYACDFRIGVNLFGMQFEIGDVEATVRRILAETGLPAHALELEITENIILNNDEAMVSPLRCLRELGVGVAFDDYGTGYASLSLLKRYPLSRLKIDRSFVRDLSANIEDRAVVSAVLYLGKSFNLKVIAEGVENAEQLELLRQAGCEEAQGYLMGKPMPADEFERLFLRRED